jgi:Tol biopolymer transport system component
MQSTSKVTQGAGESPAAASHPPIGHYRVTAPIGKGGMGEVWQATDTKLGREVAIKLLPPVFTSDPIRLARFKREAQLLASLNHPGIAAIYGIEENAENGAPALVMELVEGPTLGELIAAGPIAIDEALHILRQITEALEYAHERGVVHRDLKPANIKITPQGQVKVLDFGLAKAMAPDEASGSMSNSPTLSLAMTEAGLLLGTAVYMSPEQAKAKPADRRADIWAFGCVAFETLARKKAFDGETVSDILAAVIMSEPDWSALPAATPASIQRLLRRCLKKDLRQRLQAIGDARIAIEEAMSGADTGAAASGGIPETRRASRLRRAVPWALAAAGILAAAALLLLRWPSQKGPPLRKFEIAAGNLTVFFDAYPEISPDGKAIAYLSGGDLFVRDLDQLEPRRLYSLSGPNAIFWSPDNESIGFADQGKLWQIPVAGGAPKEICPLPETIISGAWSADGTIYFSAWRGDMYKVSAGGSDPKALELQDPKAEVDFHDLSILPGGRGLMYVVHLLDGQSRVAILEGGKEKTVFSQSGWGAWGATYSPTGHLLLMRRVDHATSIWAVPFSLSDLEATGQPFVVAGDGVYPSVSADGTLLYVKPAAQAEGQLAWVSRAGKIDGTLGTPQKGLISPALSPDGERIALIAVNSDGGRDLFVYDVASGIMTPLLSSTPSDTSAGIGGPMASISGPMWTPDGKNILFTETRDVTGQKIMSVSSDGSGQPQVLLTGILGQLSQQGNLLAYTLANTDGTSQTCYAAYSGGKVQDAAAKPTCPPSTLAKEWNPRISPDGHYAAFVAEDNGQSNVYVTHFPDGNGRLQVSRNGGASPVWSRRGDELFYVADDKLMSARVTTQPMLTLGAPVTLFSLADEHLIEWPREGPSFDVSANGQSFLMVEQVGQEPQPSMVVDQNWFAEFSRNKGN